MVKLLKRMFHLSLLILLFSVLPANAQNVTLSWDPSPTADVAGYYLYYKANNPTPPFDGTLAIEGTSPIDVGNNLSQTLTGLADNTIYYFTVTAYDSSGNESAFSNIVSNSWTPTLLSPSNNAANEPVPATFQWTTEASGTFSYTLYYGTDSNLVMTAGTLGNTGKFDATPYIKNILLVTLIGLLILLAFPKRNIAVAGCAISCALALTSCGGGGGGGGGESSSRTSSPSAAATAVVYSVDKGGSDYHQAYDLEAGTTYYWKVIGSDPANPNAQHSSTINSFTTENF
jgi:hypothetical protein